MDVQQPALQRYYQYCMGRAYFDNRSFDRDLANVRTSARIQDARLEDMMQAGRNRPEVGMRNTVDVLFPNATPVQRALLLLLTPVRALVTSLQELFAGLRPPPGGQPTTAAQRLFVRFDQVAAQIFSFFFGNRRDDNVENRERQLRRQDDLGRSELIDQETTVEGSGGAELGSGGG